MTWNALTATAKRDPEAVSATAATNAATVRRQRASKPTTPPLSGTTGAILPSAGSGSSDTGSASGKASPTSKPSERPSKPSTRRWRQPSNVREFAAQANAVATMVLNGEIDVDAARSYSSVARTVAQAMSTEVSRSRFLQTEPSLDIPSDVWEADA